MKNNQNTKEYISDHIKRVQKKLLQFSYILVDRGVNHDKSKLEEEFSGWSDMDKEPRYKYGTREYENKKKRYEWLFEKHYSTNRHHPDKWKDSDTFPFCPDLVDLIEFLCDNIAYKDNLSYNEAKSIIEIQSKRFGFSRELSDILQNTLTNYYVSFGKVLGDNLPKKDGCGNLLNIKV